MKILFDLFPVILFFIAFKVSEGHKAAAAEWLDALFAGVGLAGAFPPDQAPILVATVVVILATCGQIAWVWLRHGKVDKMLWVSLGLVVVLGGLTLALRDETFIKWKPTLLYWIFAVALLVSASLFRKNLIRDMLEAQVSLPEPIWARLNHRLGRVFRRHGSRQPDHRPQISDRCLGELQVVRRHGPDAGVHGRTGILADATHGSAGGSETEEKS